MFWRIHTESVKYIIGWVRRRIAPVGIVVALMLAAVPAVADPLANVKQVNLRYAVYLGGLHILDSDAAFNRSGGNYTIHMQAGTQGLFATMAPWQADLTSNGNMKQDQILPQASKIVTRWNNKAREVDITFKRNGKVEAHFTPPDDAQHELVPADMLKDALDPLSGVVQILASMAYGKGCNQHVPLYDGHRRFDLDMRDAGQEKLDGGDVSTFSGMARKCEAVLSMRAGSRKDVEGSRFWEDAKGKPSLPPAYIYLANIDNKLPPMPVRAETSTPFGNVMVHIVGDK